MLFNVNKNFCLCFYIFLSFIGELCILVACNASAVNVTDERCRNQNIVFHELKILKVHIMQKFSRTEAGSDVKITHFCFCYWNSLSSSISLHEKKNRRIFNLTPREIYRESTNLKQ